MKFIACSYNGQEWIGWGYILFTWVRCGKGWKTVDSSEFDE